MEIGFEDERKWKTSFPNKWVSKTELAKLNFVGNVETEVQEGVPQLAEGEVNPEMESTDPHNMETYFDEETLQEIYDEEPNVAYEPHCRINKNGKPHCRIEWFQLDENPEMESTNREIILETGVGEDGPQPTNSSASESANSTISSEATIMNCGWTAVGVLFLGIYYSYFDF